jgi:hypothetical protein
MSTAPVYSIDSSALIHAWNRTYRPKNFQSFWRLLDELVDEGRLRASIEVFEELKKKDDEVYAWAKARKGKLFVEIDDAVQVAVSDLMERYPRLVDTVRGKSGGDPFVIALAAVTQPKMVVVTQEDEGRVRIPDVCFGEGITAIKIADLIEMENWSF